MGHPFLIGSEHYAKTAREIGEEYQIVLILESVGYCDFSAGSQQIPDLVRIAGTERGDFLGVVGDHRSRHFAEDFVRGATLSAPQLKTLSYVAPPLVGHTIPELRFSDHASFWDQGYPALMLTDTAMLRNPHYHCSRDTPETISADFILGVATAVAGVLREWSNR